MADYRISTSVHDAALQYIIDNSERQVVLSADPLTYAGVAAVTLAATAMIPGDFALAAGSVSGRKVVVSAKTNNTPTANGVATHIALVDDTNNDIILLVPMPSTTLSTLVDVDFAEWEHEIRDNEAG